MARRPVRRVGLLGLLGSGNVGNDASLETVLDWFAHDLPGTRLVCITTAPEEVRRRYGIPAVALSGHRPRPGEGRVRAAAGRVLGGLRDVPRTLALAGRVDAVLVPGTGVLENGLAARSWGMPLRLLLVALACRVRGRLFVLLDVGAEAAPHRVARALQVATVRLAAHVSYRDRWSADGIRAAGGPEPDAVAADLVFAHPSRPRAVPQTGRVVVGVMAYYGPGDDPGRGAGVRARYVDALTSVLTAVVADGDRVVLVGGDVVDLDVAHEIRDRVVRGGGDGRRVEVRDGRTFEALAEEMARAEAVIASRFHNVVCAVRAGRPTVSVGYAGKSRHLMARVGLGDLCQDLLGVDAGLLGRQLRRARADAPLLSARVAADAADQERCVRSLLRTVARDVLGG